MRRNHCAILTIVAGMLMAASVGSGQTPQDWPRATLAEAGLTPDLGERIDAGVRDGRFENLHAVLVVRGGKIVLEHYYEGEDERGGRPLGRVAFGPDRLHDVRSVTKSIVGLLYGIARADGKVPSLDAKLVDQFPEYPDLADDPMRRRMTVAHALSMMLGTEWDELGVSYADPRNSERAMERANDRYRFALDRPMVAEPGTRWVYNGGATSVLGRLIAKGSGRSLHHYAEEKLFAPLGIVEFEWRRGRDGEIRAPSGLRLRPRDLAKIGRLVLDGGRWQGRQVVPAEWLEQSFRTRARTDYLDYGYHWWLGSLSNDGPRPVSGFGNGGQRLFVAPRFDLIVVVMAGNYNRPDHWQLPVAIVDEIVLPGLRRE